MLLLRQHDNSAIFRDDHVVVQMCKCGDVHDFDEAVSFSMMARDDVV